MNETEYIAKVAEITKRYEPDYQKWQKSKKARDAEIISLTKEYNAQFHSTESDKEWKGGCYLTETDQEAEERYKQVLSDRATIPWLKKKERFTASEKEMAMKKCVDDLLATKLWIVADEPKRLAAGVFTLQICEKKRSDTHYYNSPGFLLTYVGEDKPEVPSFVREFTEKYPFVAYLHQVSRYSGPN